MAFRAGLTDTMATNELKFATASSAVMVERIYKLGRAFFTLSHNDAEFSSILDRLFADHEDNHVVNRILDIELGSNCDLDHLFERLLKEHADCFWIRAACLVSPGGHKVIISGAPESGKTTLALALIFGHGWKLISEHITLVDARTQMILGYPAPFRLIGDARAILQSCDVVLPDFALSHLLPIDRNIQAPDIAGPPDTVIHLKGGFDSDLDSTEISTSQYTREILPISDVAGQMPQFLRFISTVKCFQFKGGNVEQRCQKVREVCSGITSTDASDSSPATHLKGDATRKTTDVERKSVSLDVQRSTAWLPNTVLHETKRLVNNQPLQDNLLISVFGPVDRRALLLAEYGPIYGGLLALAKGTEPRLRVLDRLPSSGMWISERAFLRSVYHTSMILNLHLPEGVKIMTSSNYGRIHDARYQSGQIFIVSTATNEVVQLDLSGTPLQVWKFPGEGDAYHLNSLDLWDGRYVVSCFGRFDSENAWRHAGPGAGLILDLNTKEALWEGLSFPHTPRFVDGRQFVCDSHTGRLLVRDPKSLHVEEIAFGKCFTRGLAFGKERMYVGLSSTAIRKNAVGIPNARIAVLDRKSFAKLDEIDLPCSEIYDIVVPDDDDLEVLSAFERCV